MMMVLGGADLRLLLTIHWVDICGWDVDELLT